MTNADLTPKIQSFVDDFTRAVDYCIQHHGIILLPFTGYFPGNVVSDLNLSTHNPEPIQEKVTQLNTMFVHLFYCVGRAMGLFSVATGLRFTVSERTSIFLAGSALQQFTIILDGVWNKMGWGMLPGKMNGRPGSVQASRNQLAYFLGRETAGKDVDFDKFFILPKKGFLENELDVLDSLRLSIPQSIFTGRIMPVLKRMDLVDFEYKIPVHKNKSRNMLKISWFYVTAIGRKIFRAVGNLKECRG